MNKSSNFTLVIGKESVGKSSLISSLTGKYAYSANFRGSTVDCDHYEAESGEIFVDTPGIFRESDAESTAKFLDNITEYDRVLLVAQGTHLADDLNDLIPLAIGKQGVIAVTFWDKIQNNTKSVENICSLCKASGLPFIPIDARSISDAEKNKILESLQLKSEIKQNSFKTNKLFRFNSPKTLIESKVLGLIIAFLLIFLPAAVAVWMANSFAGIIETPIKNIFQPIVELSQNLPTFLSHILVGNYGFLTMFPLMFVWAFPTVLLYAIFLGFYKASGLLERITTALHPVIRHFGIDGRDLVRIVMGFGCNVPAVVQTRSCSSCSRGTCVSAIAFGSACSYQFAATIGVFAAANKPFLVLPYLAYLLITTLIYARIIADKSALSNRNLLVIDGRIFLQMPQLKDVWREAFSTIKSFLRQAVPIFFAITIIASVLDFFGVVNWVVALLSPAMSIFNLPLESALPIIFSTIRKDGILLFAEPNLVNQLSSIQLLTATFFAVVALPCLVTTWTIRKELGTLFTLKMLGKQFGFATICTLVLVFAGKILWN